MPVKRNKLDVDLEMDLHGYTVDEMRIELQHEWPHWKGMSCVRLIHGRGDALSRALVEWCREVGVRSEPEPNNPGSLRIFPRERQLPDHSLKVSIKDLGLRLTPEQEAELRDPEAAKQARIAEHNRRLAEERKRKEDLAAKALEARRNEALWRAEMARLDAEERRRGRKIKGDTKPTAPVVRPPSEIKHQEGWWKAELVRVADTDTDTLKKQKRTGLEKLAPPVIAKPPEPAPKRFGPNRDVAADQALFEAALAELDG